MATKYPGLVFLHSSVKKKIQKGQMFSKFSLPQSRNLLFFSHFSPQSQQSSLLVPVMMAG
jgi:hypothetical protein